MKKCNERNILNAQYFNHDTHTMARMSAKWVKEKVFYIGDKRADLRCDHRSQAFEVTMSNGNISCRLGDLRRHENKMLHRISISPDVTKIKEYLKGLGDGRYLVFENKADFALNYIEMPKLKFVRLAGHWGLGISRTEEEAEKLGFQAFRRLDVDKGRWTSLLMSFHGDIAWLFERYHRKMIDSSKSNSSFGARRSYELEYIWYEDQKEYIYFTDEEIEHFLS